MKRNAELQKELLEERRATKQRRGSLPVGLNWLGQTRPASGSNLFTKSWKSAASGPASGPASGRASSHRSTSFTPDAHDSGRRRLGHLLEMPEVLKRWSAGRQGSEHGGVGVQWRQGISPGGAASERRSSGDSTGGAHGSGRRPRGSPEGALAIDGISACSTLAVQIEMSQESG